MSPQETKKLKLKKTYKALLLLLADKNINDISISELCRQAEVSRTYFYNNYNSMQEIISRYQEMDIKSYLRSLPHSTPMKFTQLMSSYFQLMKSEAKETELLVDTGLTDTLIETFRTVYIFLAEQKLIGALNTKRGQNPYFSSFMAGGVISIQIEWIKSGMKETPEEMGKIINSLYFTK